MFRHKWDALRMFYVIEGVASFAFGVIFAADMVYQITVVGLTPFQLVLVGTTVEVVVFCFEIPTGIIADLYSRRLSLIIGYFLIGIGFLLRRDFAQPVGVGHRRDLHQRRGSRLDHRRNRD
jgi:DHA3 family tetracycline resistance protein-like MFS transporter